MALRKSATVAKNQMDCDDESRPFRLGSDPQMDWLRCLQNDLSARSHDGPDGTNRLGEQ